VRDRTATLAELATHLQQVREDERGHLARELHDELGALLTAAKLDVARLKSRLGDQPSEVGQRLQHLTETLNSGIALKRRIIEDLRPSSLSNLGLTASLEILAREFSERSGIEVATALEPVELDESNQLTVYRLVQESLTNIGKYAEARHAEVGVRATAARWRSWCATTARASTSAARPVHPRPGRHAPPRRGRGGQVDGHFVAWRGHARGRRPARASARWLIRFGVGRRPQTPSPDADKVSRLSLIRHGAQRRVRLSA
jgi:hypothetical protein